MDHQDENSSRPETPMEDAKREMSPAQLADAMEQALDDMTEETYDPGVLRAYLEALERAAPVPPHAGARDSSRALDDWLQRQREQLRPERRVDAGKSARRKSVLWVGLAAALLTACLFGAMVAAQAAGIDVFGAVARWTEEAFSFGNIPPQSGQDPAAARSEQSGVRELSLAEKATELSEEVQSLY